MGLWFKCFLIIALLPLSFLYVCLVTIWRGRRDIAHEFSYALDVLTFRTTPEGDYK